MRKNLVLLVIICLLIIPLPTSALSISDYHTLNFEEALEDEEIAKAYSSYKENNKQITIYLFRGKGCSFCRSFLTFLNSITDEYGKYFKVVSFEVWHDTNNKALLNAVGDYLDVEVKGVPYIVIGDKVFPGYNSTFDDSIKNAIKDLYNSNNRYDVFKKMDNIEVDKEDNNANVINNNNNNTNNNIDNQTYSKESSSNNKNNNGIVILCNFIFTMISTLIIVVVICLNNNSINKRINEIKKEGNYEKNI